MVISITVNAGKKDRIDFPVTPEMIETSDGVENTSINVSNLGEIVLKGKRNLTSISWSSFFPHEAYDFCVAKPFRDPAKYYRLIKKWMAKNYTVTLDIPGILSLNCLIESFVTSPIGGVCDINYSITFKQEKEVDAPSAKKQTAKRPTKSVVAHLYKWKKGDTWKKVAKKETGDSNNSARLVKLNRNRIDKAHFKYFKKTGKASKGTAFLVGVDIMIK